MAAMSEPHHPPVRRPRAQGAHHGSRRHRRRRGEPGRLDDRDDVRRPGHAAWRPTRWACSGGSSSTTWATAPGPSSTRGSSRATGSGPTTRAACPSRASAGRSCAPTRCTWSASTSTATRSPSRPPNSRAGCFQHELDHLDGILLVERLNEDQRKEALKILRSRTLDLPASDPDGLATSSRSNARFDPLPSPVAVAPPTCPTVIGWPGSHTSAPRTWRCRRCTRWSRPATTSSLCVTRPDRRRGRGATETPSPVKEAALRARHPRHPGHERSGRDRCRARRRGGVRPHHPGSAAERAPHGERPFLAPASVARRGAGRAGDPRGRLARRVSAS